MTAALMPVRARTSTRNRNRGHMDEPMKSLVALYSLLAIVASPATAVTQQADYRGRAQELSLESLPGRVPSYYSSGARERAAALQKTLQEAAAFFEARIGVAPISHLRCSTRATGRGSAHYRTEFPGCHPRHMWPCCPPISNAQSSCEPFPVFEKRLRQKPCAQWRMRVCPSHKRRIA